MSDSEEQPDDREQQLDAIIAEYYRLEEKGEAPDQKEFMARYPVFQHDLNEFFADLGMFEHSGRSDSEDPALEPTITPGTSQRKNLAAGAVVRYFGVYEILEELGSGGMGVVYKARHARLRKLVALKMIRAGELASEFEVKMFQAEARAAAKLDHPGIVSVHEVGMHAGQHFYSMDYVAGGSLSKLHRDEPVAARRAAELVRQMAEAIYYAHGEGIVHRDLKPANILLTTDGVPRITDFGLAKRLWAGEDSVALNVTETGQILGTAGYMSPEQAEGKTRLVGPPADIYALGAVLYALLTSRAPFIGESQADTIRQVIEKEPVSPRVLNPSLPRDLETICLKCLSKERHERYGTAQLLADDLGRFVEGRPVLARPISRPARAWRWCRRNPWVATAVALLMIIAFGSPPFAYQQYRLTKTTITQKEDIKKKAEQIEADAKKLSEYAEKLAEQNTQIKGLFDDVTKELSEKNAALAKVTSAEAKEREARGIAETETAAKSLTLYVSDMNRMQALWQEASLRTMKSLLARHVPAPEKPDLRDFEWYYWQRKCHQERRQFIHGSESHLLALSPDGKWLATAGPLDEQTHAIKVWNLDTDLVEKSIPVGQVEIVAMEFTADGSQLVTVRQGKGVAATVLNWRTGETGLTRPLERGDTIPGAPTGRYALSASGKLAARSYMGGVSCLRLDNGEWFQIKLTDEAEIQRAKTDRVIYSTPQGKYVYFRGDVPGTTRIRHGGLITETSLDPSRFPPVRSWNIGDELAPPREEDGGPVFALTFSPAEDRLAAGSRHGELVVWELSSGNELIRVEAHADIVWDIAFSADGKQLATASKDGQIKLWDIPSGQLRTTIEAHADGVRTVEFSKRGMLVSGGNDHCAKVWSAVTGSAVATFRGHEQAIDDVVCCSDGETIFSTSRDGTVNEWSLQDTEQPIVVADSTPLTCLDLFPGGDLLAATGVMSNEVTVWEFGTGKIKATLRGQRDWAFHVRVAPDGNSVVSGTWDGTFTTWDIASEKIIAQRKFPLRGRVTGMPATAISPNARRLAGACADGKTRVFDLDSGQEIATLDGDVLLARMRFSPDSSELLTFVKNDNAFDIRLWNAETGTALEDIVAGDSIALAAFSDDGKLLAWCERLGTPDSTSLAVKVWDRPTKAVKQQLALPIEMTTVQAVAFSPDHSLVAAIASENRPSKNAEPKVSALLVWDVTTGRKLHHFEEAGAALRFLPDGHTIAVAGDSGRVNVWDLVEGRKLKTLARPFGPAMSVAYVTNGTALKETKLLVASQAPPREGMVAPKRIARTFLAMSDSNRQEQGISSVHIAMPKTVFQPISDGTLSERGWLVRLLKLDTDATKQFGFVNSVTPSLDAYAPTTNCIFVLCPNGTLLKGPIDKQRAVTAVVGAVANVEDAKAMAATPDGRWVALAVGATVQLWDGDQLVLRHTLEGHEDSVRSLAFSRDGELLSTGGLDRSVRLWNTNNGSLRATLLGHLKPITCLAFSDRGRTVFSASYDGTIRLWDTATGEAKTTLTGHVGPVHWIELSPEGDELASAGEDGTVRLWRGPSTFPK